MGKGLFGKGDKGAETVETVSMEELEAARREAQELAESLGITYQTLYLKLHKYGLIDAKEKQ